MISRPVLILGVPRSGTTWIEHVLGASPGVQVAHEPDNETETPWPLVAKAGLGRFPLLKGDESAHRYEALWREAFSGASLSRRIHYARRIQQRLFTLDMAEAACDPCRRLPLSARSLAFLARPGPRMAFATPATHVVVKSVHAVLCADWLARRFAPALVVVQRDPIEVVASWRGMAARRDAHGEHLEYAGHPERVLSPRTMQYLTGLYGPAPSSARHSLTWLAGALMSELTKFAAGRADAEVLDFDQACIEPEAALSEVARRVGLPWTDQCEAKIRAFDVRPLHHRVAQSSALVPSAWRRQLDPAEVYEIERELWRFPALRSGLATAPS